MSFNSHKNNAFCIKVVIIHLPGFRMFLIPPWHSYTKTVDKYFPLGSQRPDPVTIPPVRHPSETSRLHSMLSSKPATLSTLTKVQKEFESKIVSLKYWVCAFKRSCLGLPWACACDSVEASIENPNLCVCCLQPCGHSPQSPFLQH